MAQTTTTNNPAPAQPSPRKDAIDKIIAAGGATEADRKGLEDAPDPVFQLAVKGATPPPNNTPAPAPPAPAQAPPAQGAQTAPAPAQQVTPPAAQLTPEQYIAQAPPALQEVLGNALATHNQQKQQLVDNIFANPNNRFSKEWLSAQSIQMLQGIADLAKQTQNGQQAAPPVYLGQGQVPMFKVPAPGQTQNGQQQPQAVQPLVPPSIISNKKAADKKAV